MRRKARKLLLSSKGSASIEFIFIMLAVLVAIVAFLNITFVKSAQDGLNTYARELCRTAEMSGRIGEETTERAQKLTESMGLSPDIRWSETGDIQLGGDITVICTKTEYIGLGGIGSWPVELRSTVSGKSEVYWK